MEKAKIKQKLKTPITYYGGKQTMLKHILPLIPDHTIYTESFVGGAAVLFAKEPAPVEVVNDLNSELINFYWAASVYYLDLKKLIDKSLHSRAEFEHAGYIYNNPKWFTPIERAWALWVRTKMSFASKIDGTFGFDKAKGSMTKKITNAKDAFTEALCSRLEHVTIENQDAMAVIKRFDTKDAFHFVDPPYVNTNCGHYKEMFNAEDLNNLLQVLSSIEGKFMLTMFPNESIAEQAENNNWSIHRIERQISSSRIKRRVQEEWIVINY